MDINKLEETIAAIEMLKELGLPVNIEQLQKQRELEAQYLRENLVPQIQSQVQTLVDKIHIPFCLVIDYQYGTPVQVRIAEKTKIKADVNPSKQKKETSRSNNISNVYASSHIQAKWKDSLQRFPNGELIYKVTISQPHHSLSRLLHVMQSKEMLKYTSSLFEMIKPRELGRITPKELTDILEPEQFIKEKTREGSVKRIVLWTQVQKVETRNDGSRIKVYEEDGITPVKVDKIKKIKEGQWTLKTLCDLIAQKEYFANLHSAKQNQ